MKHFLLALTLLFSSCTYSNDFHQCAQEIFNHIAHDEFETARSLLSDLLVQVPQSIFINYNMAYLLRYLDRSQEAIIYYRKTLEWCHDISIIAQAHLGLAKSLLSIGNFSEGWREFEWRYVDPDNVIRNKVYNTQPKDFKDKIVFIRAEWGLGDSMQWIRFIKLIKEQKPKKILVQTFKPLIPLFSRCDYIDQIIEKGMEPKQFDIQIPLMSLPYIFNITLDTLPTDIPYLQADEDLVTYWREYLKSDTNLRIGLCWHSKPIAHLEDHKYTKRSIPLNLFAPLAEVEGISFYSLQKVYGEKELDNLPEGFIVHSFGPDFDERHGAFMDTAAVIENLDLVITADTSIVHLAGALGKPVWVLLPFCAEWRWLKHRTDTPWYPTIRLFRSTKIQQWKPVIKEVKKELAHLVHLKQLHEASYDHAAYFAYAHELKQTHQTEKLAELYHDITIHEPHNILTRYNRAHALKDLDRLDEAIQEYDAVLVYNPEYAPAHLGRAQCYLAQGNFDAGWPDFEWRGPQIRQFNHHEWENADLTGLKVLLRCEWGFGDCIQFIRYAKRLKEHGAFVILQIYSQLKTLMSNCPYIDEVVAVGELFPDHDIQIPLLSLPYTFNETVDTVPIEPYLSAEPAYLSSWADKLKETTGLKIGICWHGKGDQKAPPSHNKNIPLAACMPLFEFENIHLYSLQKYDGIDQITIFSGKNNFHHFDNLDESVAFRDTAALIKQLDLIITVDTSIAHLAGALGKPVWLMLPYKADWRWQIGTSQSIWYPTMRIFRQPTPGNWQQVIEDICAQLKQ